MAKKSISEKVDFLKKNVFASNANNKSYTDERFWVPTRNDKGEASAVIRLLPNKDENSLPFVKNYKHSIRVEQNNFVDRCPTTVGKVCPICEWNLSQDKLHVKELASYRRTTWIHNILVVNDPGNPSNNGKVFLFEFGKQLFGVLKESADENTEDNDEPFLYYDFELGGNLKVKVKKDNPNDQFPTWLHSKFMAQEPIEKTLKGLGITMEDITKSLYDIEAVIKDANYKEYDALKSKFDAFLTKTKLEERQVAQTEAKAEAKSAEDYAAKKAKATSKTDDDDEPVEPETPKAKTAIDAKMDKVNKAKEAKNFFDTFGEDV